MSLENAKENLKEFGKELNLEGLSFDENHTCILGIDNTFSLHLTYEPNSDRLSMTQAYSNRVTTYGVGIRTFF